VGGVIPLFYPVGWKEILKRFKTHLEKILDSEKMLEKMLE